MRSTSVLTLTTALSRFLGFGRDLLIARLFGTTMAAQAFVVAFRLPNLLRDLVAEGAVTSAFVPVLSWYRAKGAWEEFWTLSQALFTRVAVLVTAIGFVGMIGAPWIVRFVAPGFAADPEKFHLTVQLTRILFPFITLVGLWAFFMGLLNSLRHFAMPSLGPAILNLAMIVACVWVVPKTHLGVVALAVGVMVGGVIQLLVQLPVAIRLGFRWRWRWHHPGSKEILRLLGPRVVGSAAYQASVLIDTILASLTTIVGEGAVAALYFANRLVQLPLALFGTSFAQASLPVLAEQAAHEEFQAFGRTLLSVLRMVGFVMIPSAIALMVLAFPIVGGLFERGAFTHQATIMTAQALIWYSFGLLAYAFAKVLSGAFYALRETRTPVRLAIEAMGVNALVSVLLMWPLKVNGLAIAAALTNSMNAYRLVRRMEDRLKAQLLAPLLTSLLPMLVAAVGMGIAVWSLWPLVAARLGSVLGLGVVILTGLFLYGGGCAVLRVRELSLLLPWLKPLRLSAASSAK